MNESERSAAVLELQAIARGDALCGALEASCMCELPHDHDSPHECACLGSWDTRNGFEIVRLPVIGGIEG